MKIKQKVAIGIYRARIHSLALLSPEKAGKLAFKIFCTPYSGKPKRTAPSIFQKATPISFSVHKTVVRGWQWKNEQGNGKKILIIHGFDSFSYRFEKYITHFKKLGFEVIAFDAPGHGISDGKIIHSLLYKQTIEKAADLYGPFHGIMAHSLGGLATSLAIEHNNSIAQKAVLIAPATESSRALDNFCTFLKLKPGIKQEIEKHIQKMAHHPLAWFAVSRAIKNVSIPILWLHDEEDAICPFADVVPIMEQNQPNISFYITKGLGHSKIYRDTKSLEKIINFFSK